MRAKKFALFCLISLSACAGIGTDRSPSSASEKWTQWSGDIHNNHNMTPASPVINRQNVASLKTEWTFAADSNVIATPTSVKGMIYFNDSSNILVSGLFTCGSLYAVNSDTGAVIEISSER